MPEKTRSIWAARIVALILIFVFTMLFWNLYSTLTKLRAEMDETAPIEVRDKTTP